MTFKHWLRLAAVLGYTACAQLAGAANLAGVNVPSTLSIDGRTLELVSCGVRDTLWIDHYVAALYLPRGATMQAVRDPRQAKAVLIHIVETRYLPEQIPEKWLQALEREVARAPLARVRRAYRRLSDGDEMIIAYVPGRRVSMLVNGKTVARFSGQAVIDSILAAWAQDEPVGRKLDALRVDHACA